MAQLKRYLVLDTDGTVVNAIAWDGESPYDPGDGLALELVPAGSYAGIGWRKVGGDFLPPEPPANDDE